jgi:hypothetical protein
MACTKACAANSDLSNPGERREMPSCSSYAKMMRARRRRPAPRPITRQTTKGSTVTKGQFLAYLALGPLLLFVSATSGCAFIAPYTKDRLAFDAEVRSWGLLGLTEQDAKQALLAHGMQDAVRVYPCTQSVRPECEVLPYLKKPPGPPYVYGERKQTTGIFCARIWWVSLYLDAEGGHTQRLEDGIRDGEKGCTYP